MLNKEFVAVVEQVGDFTTTNVNGRIKKTGGNVASYFCTPSGRVINGVLGPVDADELIREASWAIETIQPVRDSTFDRQLAYVNRERRKHCGECTTGANHKNRELATYLKSRPLPYLDNIYEYVFQNILDEKLSTAGLTVAQAAEKMKEAKETGRPLLFVIHNKDRDRDFRRSWVEMTRGSQTFDRNMRKMLADYIVISLRKDQQAALSHVMKQPPYKSPSGGWPLFVVARPDASQVEAMAGKWCSRSLGELLATSWIDAIGDRKLTSRQVKLALVIHRKLGDAPEDKFEALLAQSISK